jgi:hypothetical protein
VGKIEGAALQQQHTALQLAYPDFQTWLHSWSHGLSDMVSLTWSNSGFYIHLRSFVPNLTDMAILLEFDKNSLAI